MKGLSSAVATRYIERITDAIRTVTGKGPVGLHEPCFQGNEWLYLKECLDSNFVSSVGEFVNRFEADLIAYTGSKHAVAVMNGTAALHVALMLVGVKPYDEVLIPTLTFVATANAVRYCGATPHFVDSEESTLGMAAEALRDYLQYTTKQHSGQCINRATDRVIRALMPMHTFGHPVDLDGLLAIARDFNLVLIEDAAESLGSLYDGKHTGTFGLVSAFSFNGNKTITTGGGGAILTGDVELAKRAKHLTTTARVSNQWVFEHDEIGYNYRMPNINAALGCAQLEQLPGFLAAKKCLYERYRIAFSNVDYVQLVSEPDKCQSNYWLQTILLDKKLAGERDAILAATNNLGLSTRPTWRLMHRLVPFRDCPRAPLPVAESLEQRLINIPSSSFLI